MSLFICGPSAVAHYRCAVVLSELDDDPKLAMLTDAISRVNDLEATSLAGLCVEEPSESAPLHFLVAKKTQRPRSKMYVGHACRAPLPANSFYRVSAEVHVTCPELTFVQMAGVLELPQLVALGMEFCGTYRRNVTGAATPGFSVPQTIYDQPQLTTKEQLKTYIDAASPMPGVKQARRALEFVLEGSASPFETIVYLLLCLPRRLGGYALPTPELNPPITFTDRAKTFTTRSSARGDLYWRAAKLDLEYNGSDHEFSRSADSMRRKALEKMKVQVIELTNDEVRDVDMFHATVLRIARTLGVRVRVERDFDTRRAYLRDLLLNDTGGLGDDYDVELQATDACVGSEEQASEEFPGEQVRFSDEWDEDTAHADDEWERNMWLEEQERLQAEYEERRREECLEEDVIYDEGGEAEPGWDEA